MEIVLIHSEQATLRSRFFWEDSDAVQLAKFYNNFYTLEKMKNDDEYYYKSYFYKKDKQASEVVKHFMLKMIEQYNDIVLETLIVKSDHVDNEMVALSAVKDPDIYRQVLQALYMDEVLPKSFSLNIDYSYKLKSLTSALIHGTQNMWINGEDEVPFVSPMDMNLCCDLARTRIDKLIAVRLDAQMGAEQLHKTFDQMNIILRTIAKFKLKPFSEEVFKKLEWTLSGFLDSLGERALKVGMLVAGESSDTIRDDIIPLVVVAKSLDEQEIMTHKMGLRFQARYAL